MTQQIPATLANHVAVEIAARPEAVWQLIQDEYVAARKFGGGALEWLDDPAAVVSYRMRMEHGEAVDERIVRITERDHEARRLSAQADYLTLPAGGMGVWACYHAQEVPGSPGTTRYAIDCHARLGVEVPDGATREQIQAAVLAVKQGFDTALLAYLNHAKAMLEAAG